MAMRLIQDFFMLLWYAPPALISQTYSSCTVGTLTDCIFMINMSVIGISLVIVVAGTLGAGLYVLARMILVRLLHGSSR